ncbi:hypothetical protein QVD17_35857 [Tagetes erecta]|uniref:Uncharacterized protein n=1 Tax=Tagetes erecta TaxID=13708 RepID=A0AAD8JV77_TARER|nr:hypothetical protein QVD17_35857 [Tagetes erecta]
MSNFIKIKCAEQEIKVCLFFCLFVHHPLKEIKYGVGNEMTKEGDIYSFGIFLLEMITGRRPTDSIFEEGFNLHGYVKMALPDRLMEVIEPGLLSSCLEVGNGYSKDEARKSKILEDGMLSLARIGLACSMESPGERMNMSNVIHELQRIDAILQNT